VHHILAQLNWLIDKHGIDVVVVGPVIKEDYYQQCLPQLGKVIYLGVIPK
jgi:hypothetical protein